MAQRNTQKIPLTDVRIVGRPESSSGVDRIVGRIVVATIRSTMRSTIRNLGCFFLGFHIFLG